MKRPFTGRSPASGGGARPASSLLLVPPAAVLGLLFFIPLLSMLRFITPGTMAGVLGSRYYRSIIAFTFAQAGISTVVSVLLGLPGAWIMSHVRFRGKRLLYSLTTVPFVLPSILAVLGFVLCFGNNGIINSLLMRISGSEEVPLRILYSFKAIILAHAFYNFPVCLRLVSGAWKQTGSSRIEAAEILGAGRLRIFFTVSLPSILPSIIAAASLIFIFCFMSFAVILVLGGGPAFSTVEVEIYRLARIELELGTAASLALAGAVITAILTFIYIRLQKMSLSGFDGNTKPVKETDFRDLGSGTRTASVIYLVLVVVLILGPLAAVVQRSFVSRSGWSGELKASFKPYMVLFSSASSLTAVRNSIIFALSSTAVSVSAGLAAAYATVRGRMLSSSLAETVFMLPLGVSAVVLGLGYYSISGILPGFGTGLLIVLAHSVISLPFAVRTLSTGLQHIDPALLDAASTLGAGRLRSFLTVELPLMRGSLISASAFAFCISAGEINASLILSGGSYTTIPITIYRLISSYKFFSACAMGTVLIVICAAAFYLIDRFGGEDLF